MSERAMMALFDPGHRLSLPNGYALEKSNDDVWQVIEPPHGHCMGMVLTGTVRVGKDGSMDSQVKQFADAMKPLTTTP